jgi:hypothetical protein
MLPTFSEEIRRFHQVPEDLGRLLENQTPRNQISADQLLHGPLADTMTHAGQLAMVRGLAGASGEFHARKH